MPSITCFEASAPRSPSQDRRAVRDHGNEIALARIFVRRVRVLRDRAHWHRDARAVGERQVVLRRHRLRGVDFELPGLALGMEEER
ncbi:MAG: hypothetical protein RIE56_09700, partial [Amphiplicatus sp.]